MSDYLALAADIAALIGPTTDPASDNENAAIIRLSGNTRTDGLSRANSTVGDGSLPYIGISAANAAGTISHVAGSSTLVGTGTSFTTAFPVGSTLLFLDIPAASDPFGIGYICMMNVSVVDDTHLTISYQTSLATKLPAFSGVTWRVADSSKLTTLDVMNQWIGYTIYYDFPWCLYQAAYKHAGTVDGPSLMAKADLLAKVWWEHPFRAMEARFGPTDGNYVTSPRQESLGGMLIWALRSCPGATDPTGTATLIWDFLKENVEDHWSDWFAPAVISDTKMSFDVRDRGYLLHYTVMLAAVHPDSTVRSDCLAKALDVAVNYFARLQFADGSWRATNPAWWSVSDGKNTNAPAAQPFLTGLLLNALIDLHRLIRANPTYSSEAATILAAIKLGVEGQMRAYAGSPNHAGYSAVTSQGTAAIRGMTYAYSGPDLSYGPFARESRQVQVASAMTFTPAVPTWAAPSAGDRCALVVRVTNLSGTSQAGPTLTLGTGCKVTTPVGTYYLTATPSDLAAFSSSMFTTAPQTPDALSTSAPGSGTLQLGAAIAGNGYTDWVFYTPNIDGQAWGAGAVSVTLTPNAANANIALSVEVARVNSAGVVQQITTTYAAAIPGDPDGNRWYDPKGSIEYTVDTVGQDYYHFLSGAIAAQRFLNSTTVHAPFYAALYETNSTKRTSYLSFGDELLKAQWEYTDGDGYRSQYNTAYPKNKDWDEHMRAQMRGLAWRKMAVAGLTAEDTSGAGGQVADHLAITAQPSASTQSGFAHAQQPAGVVEDASDATVLGDTSTVTATLVLESGSGTARGTTVVQCVGGAFTFAGTGLGVDSAGGCTAHWDLSRPGLPTVSTASFTITPPPVASVPFRGHRAAIL